MFDHGYMVAVLDHPPDVACTVFAFLLNQFALGQLVIVSIIAVNAFHMVVRRTPLNYGRNDWKVLVMAGGFPAVVGVAGVLTETFGPTGVW